MNNFRSLAVWIVIALLLFALFSLFQGQTQRMSSSDVSYSEFLSKVDSGEVNGYIKDITGQDFSAKDFRTWAGTVLAALALSEFKKYDSQAEAKRNVVAAIEKVAKQLGNTPAICRKSYVHPEILTAYMSGDLIKMIDAKIAQKFKRQYAKLTSDEIMVLAFLHKRLWALKSEA